MKTTIIILSFFFASAIGRGVKELRLVTGSLPNCGGVNIGIKIQSGRNVCVVIPKQRIFGNRVATWRGAQLGNCASFNVDQTSRVYFQTDSGSDGFCPELLQVSIDDQVNTLYEAQGNYYYGYFTKRHNNVPYGVTKEWPKDGTYIRPQDEPLFCPPDNFDTCPLDEMYAYRIGSRDRKNCLFECNTVASVSKTTNYSETVQTGFRCVVVDFDSVQFDWCCKTHSTQGGIPHCPDVLSGSSNQPEQEVGTSATITETPLVAEVPTRAVAVPGQCPESGCPIRNVKTYYDVQEPRTYDVCEIRFECDNVMSADPYDPESGMECTRSNSPMRKALKCCNHPTAHAQSDLPQCSAVESRNAPPVQNNVAIGNTNVPVQNNELGIGNTNVPVQNNELDIGNTSVPPVQNRDGYGIGIGNPNVQELDDRESTVTNTEHTNPNPIIPPQGSLADGCPTSTIYPTISQTIENPTRWQVGAVRCCSHDGSQCVTPKTPCLWKTFEEAKGICNSRGMRICKPEELSGGKCCDTGCHFDGALVWQMN